MILGEINEGHSQDSNLNLCDLDPFQKSSLLQEKWKSGYVQEIHVQKQEGFKVIYRNEEDLEKCMWIQEQTEKIDFCKWSFLMVDKVIQKILRVVCFVDRDSEL